MLVRVERATFTEHLAIAATRAREFASRFVIEPLPDAMRFRLSLRAPLAKEHGRWIMFERDVDRVPIELSADEVVEELWRDGRAPEWVNTSVASERDGDTIVELVACPRFSHDPSYHVGEGIPPFHVLGPSLPFDHAEGERFSIHRDYACIVEADVDHLARVGERVESISFAGTCATSRTITRLPSLPRARVLDVAGVGDLAWVAALARHPSLTSLRATIRSDAELDARTLPPRLETLSLETRGALAIRGTLPTLRDLTLRAARIDGDLLLPHELESLSLGVRNVDPRALDAALAHVQRVESLSLGGTPVPDALARSLATRLRPRHLHLGETGVAASTLDAIARELPGTRVRPRPR